MYEGCSVESKARIEIFFTLYINVNLYIHQRENIIL